MCLHMNIQISAFWITYKSILELSLKDMTKSQTSVLNRTGEPVLSCMMQEEVPLYLHTDYLLGNYKMLPGRYRELDYVQDQAN